MVEEPITTKAKRRSSTKPCIAARRSSRSGTRTIADEFTATVEGTAPAAWDQPAPPEGCVARDVVRHLIDWFPAFLQEATEITLPAGPSVDHDPVGAWHPDRPRAATARRPGHRRARATSSRTSTGCRSGRPSA